jgi:EmrB/QacA subfamily drug resistance transporter
MTLRDRRWQILAVVSAASFMVYMDTTVVIVAFPSLRGSFPDVSQATLSWTLYGYGVVFAALLVPAGRWGDRLGRVRAFEIGLIAFIAASAICASAQTAGLLIAARLAQAAAGALMVPNAQALMMSAFPRGQRALAIGLFSGAGAVAAAVGPSLAGLLTDISSWRPIFLINVPIGLGALLYGRTVLGKSQSTREAALPDAFGVVLLTAGIASFMLALTQGRRWGWDSGGVIACFGSAAVLLPLFVVRSARHATPVVDVRLFRDRQLAVANAASLIFASAFFGILFAGALFLTTAWNYSELDTGLGMTPAPLLTLLTAALGGWLADRHGARWVAVGGAAIFAAGTAWALKETTLDPDYLGAWLPATILIGIGVGLCAPVLNSAAVTALSEARFGVGSGINSMMRQLGGALGTAAIVAIVGNPTHVDAVTAFRGAWAFAGCAAVLTLVLSLLIPKGVRIMSADFESQETPH